MKIKLIEEPVGGDTVFPSTGYNIITISHVFYYIQDKEDRRKLFLNLQNVLAPGGRLIIMQFDSEMDGKPSQFVSTVASCFGLMKPAKEELAAHLSGTPDVLASTIYEEYKPLMKPGVTCDKFTFYTMLSFFDIDKDHDHFYDIMSLVLSADLRKMSKPAHDAIRKVVKENTSVVMTGETKWFFPDCILTFTKSY